MKKNYCTITVRRKGWPDLECAYNGPFIEELKSKIHHRDRKYDPETKIWTFHPSHLHTVKELAKEHFEVCWLVEGAIVTNLHTGETVEQMEMFV